VHSKARKPTNDPRRAQVILWNDRRQGDGQTRWWQVRRFVMIEFTDNHLHL
jgi:hypothetical protein